MRMTWPYLAGLFDGEGCLISTQSLLAYRMQIVQGKNNGGLALFEEVRDFLKGYSVVAKITCSHATCKRGWNPLYVLYISRQQHLKTVLEKLLPYLRVKKTVAQDCLRIIKLFPVNRTKCGHFSLGRCQKCQRERHARWYKQNSETQKAAVAAARAKRKDEGNAVGAFKHSKPTG